MPLPHLLAIFPGLGVGGAAITSVQTTRYNCIAWVAKDTRRWWWPLKSPQAFWPSGLERQVTLEAFEAAFNGLGYARCSDESLEPRLEKIAFFAKDGVPTHGARQLPDGLWTSKLG